MFTERSQSPPILRPSTTITLNGLPLNHSQVSAMLAQPNHHILNIHPNNDVTTTTMIEYIHLRLSQTKGYALSIVQSFQQAETQKKLSSDYLNTIIIMNEENLDWKSILQPSILVILSPKDIFLLGLNPKWMQEYGLPSIIFINNF